VSATCHDEARDERVANKSTIDAYRSSIAEYNAAAVPRVTGAVKKDEFAQYNAFADTPLTQGLSTPP